ncbi:hypothetical protein KBC99_03300, partial [Candidatus Saccharibacteria bacterium]|nr:hypothetical protein [Candidatus Saccharibacteria bacterium]
PSSTDIVAETFKLTSEEKARLTQFPVGEGLFFAGSNHVIIRILASPMEEQLITTNPQELLERRMRAQSESEDISLEEPPNQDEATDTAVAAQDLGVTQADNSEGETS